MTSTTPRNTMNTTETVTTPTGKALRVRAVPVGQNFGFAGQLVSRNGRVVWEGDAVGFREAALRDARDAAAKL